MFVLSHKQWLCRKTLPYIWPSISRNVQPFLEIIKFLGMKNSYKQKTGTTKSAHACIGCTPPKFNIAQMMVGKWVSFWDCLCFKGYVKFQGRMQKPWLKAQLDKYWRCVLTKNRWWSPGVLRKIQDFFFTSFDGESLWKFGVKEEFHSYLNW